MKAKPRVELGRLGEILSMPAKQLRRRLALAIALGPPPSQRILAPGSRSGGVFDRVNLPPPAGRRGRVASPEPSGK